MLQKIRPFLENPLNLMLPLAVVAVILNAMDASPVLVLFISALAMIPCCRVNRGGDRSHRSACRTEVRWFAQRHIWQCSGVNHHHRCNP